MATSVLTSYEQQFTNLTADVTAFTARISNHSGSEKQKLIRQASKTLEEVNELVEQIELEVREIPLADRGRYQSRLKSYKAEVQRLTQDLKQAKASSHDEARDELFAYDPVTDDQKARLLDNTEKLERTGKKLDAGYRVCLETERIGSDVLNELHTQRETIQRARSRMRETDAELSRSARILSSMWRRAMKDKIVLYGIVAFMIIAIIATLYFTLSR